MEAAQDISTDLLTTSLKQLIHDLISPFGVLIVLQRLGIVFHCAQPEKVCGETARLGKAFRICWSLVTKGTPKS